jgi:hypothetical protein
MYQNLKSLCLRITDSTVEDELKKILLKKDVLKLNVIFTEKLQHIFVKMGTRKSHSNKTLQKRK